VRVILLGGDYQKDSQVNVGPLVKQVVDNFHVDKLFVGVDGFDEERGFTGSSILRCDAAQVMASRANETIILTDSNKFTKIGHVKLFAPIEVSRVYTDKELDEEIKQKLTEKNIQVKLV
jgi:DeoR/GlpR family transcriptional regulator of sugar metabolism